ncbi:MAG: M28 family peptidase [Candidatus Hodarchaeales archaeon]
MNLIKWIFIFLSIVCNSSILSPLPVVNYFSSLPPYETSTKDNFTFNSTRAYDIIQKQVDLGPRYPGSEGIKETRRLIASELLPTQQWIISYQNFSRKWIDNQNVILVNIICQPKGFNSTQPSFLLLAHYDTRLWATNDPDSTKQKDHVLGANDGASGVAVALELGRVLLEDYNNTNFQLIFFDGEDQGKIYGWDWLVGSRFYVNSQEFLNQNLSFAILFDMVGGKDAIFEREKNSDQYAGKLVTQIWNEADTLGFNNYFVNQSGKRILDDHIPFLEKSIPSIDIIDDFGYRFKPWHTSFDNMTFIDTKTLEAVGKTMESVLVRLTSSMELTLSLSTFNFRTPVTIFSLLSGYLLLTLENIYRKRKNSKHQTSPFLKAE